jgi:DNA-binding NarL/FixJ family response regulator
MRTSRPSIILVDANALLRQGLRSLLEASGEFNVVGEARDGIEAMQGALAHCPQLMLIDSHLPGLCGIETVAQIKRRAPEIRVVTLSDTMTDDGVRESLSAGADGYVLKSATFEELLSGLRCVASGKRYLSPAVSSLLVEGYLNPVAADANVLGRAAKLTARERSILQLIAEGRTNRATAMYLSVSQKTVEKHRANLMRKIGVHNATELMMAAIDLGIVDRPVFSRRRSAPQELESMRSSL